MPPIGDSRDVRSIIQEHIDQNKVAIFSKSYCSFSKKVKTLFDSLSVSYGALELDVIEKGAEIQATLLELTGQRTVPNVFIGGQHVGGCDNTLKLHSENRLLPMIRGEISEESYDYDLVVIGGGSGGLAAAKEAAKHGQRVACLDFVKPTPQGTTWGLGGTCVNVGCIPKKLMHQTALLQRALKDAREFGWEFSDQVSHSWDHMKQAVQDHIGSLNFNHRVALRSAKVTYINAYAEFIAPHKIKCTDGKNEVKELTSRFFIIATGGRPRYPSVPGAKEFGISSDDVFSLPYCPGKTLSIGASYVSLECAGFLRGLGLDVTVMVRSILLRGFDQQMAELAGDFMKAEGINFLRPCVPTKVEKVQDGSPGLYRVTGLMNDGSEVVDEYNTVLFAIGRDPCTSDLHLDRIGVRVNTKTGYVICGDDESTSCPYVYAVGDVIEGRPELTPVAIQAGRLLARRLFAGHTLKCDYDNVPTTIFTPLEYGAIGLSEEQAIAKYGQEDIEVYHTNFIPLEWTVPHHNENACYAKLICVPSLDERVVGLHVLGPNAGEMTQGWTVGMKLHATKADFDNAIGIHPTCAEIFTTMNITKRSGVSSASRGC